MQTNNISINIITQQNSLTNCQPENSDQIVIASETEKNNNNSQKDIKTISNKTTHISSNYNFYIINNIVAFIICTIIIFSCWIVAFNCEDVFVYQSYITYLACWIGLTYAVSVIFFYRPCLDSSLILKPLLFCFVIVTISTLKSKYIISYRLAPLIFAQLTFIFFIKLFLDYRLVIWLLALISANAFFLCLYALLQMFNIDFIIWNGSPYKIVATFSNPNFFAGYLVLTLPISIGVFVFLFYRHWYKLSIFIATSIILQIITLYATECEGAIISFNFSLIILINLTFSKFYTIKIPRQIFIVASICSVIIVSFYHVLSIAFNRYPWQDLAEIPNYIVRKFLARIFEWYMGYNAYLESPLFGSGAGSSIYLLSKYRPAESIVIGLSSYNDNTHSIALSILVEHGFLGLLAFTMLLCVIIYSQNMYIYKAQNAQSRFIKTVVNCSSTTHYSIMNSSLTKIFDNNLSRHNYLFLSLALFSGIVGTLIHSLFNTTLDILPIANLFAISVGLQQLIVTGNMKFKHKRTVSSLVSIIIPIMYFSISSKMIINYEYESKALYKGKTNILANKFYNAQIYFEQALQHNPQSLQALWGISNCLIALNQANQAFQFLNLLDNLAPNAFNSKFHISELLFNQQKLLDARKFALDALKSYKSPSVYLLLGKIHIKLRQFKIAKALLEEGLILVPMWIAQEAKAAQETLYNLALLEIEQKNYISAIDLLNRINLRYFDKTSEVLYQLGFCYYNLSSYTQALSYFEEAYNQVKTDPKYLNALGYLLLEQDIDIDKARLLLEQAYDLYKLQEKQNLSQLLSITHSLGILYWKLGELEKAQELLILAYRNCPDDFKETKKQRKESLVKFFKETKRQVPAFLKSELSLN